MSASSQNLEVARMQAQEMLDAQRTHEDRNKLGQFATPSALALDMLKLVKSGIPRKFKMRFLSVTGFIQRSSLPLH